MISAASRGVQELERQPGDVAFRPVAVIGSVGEMSEAVGAWVVPIPIPQERDERQVDTGIAVNDHPNLARQEFDRLKAILHDCRHRGPPVANRQHHNDFRAHLLGRISKCAALNPARGTRPGAFDAISWEQEAQLHSSRQFHGAATA